MKRLLTFLIALIVTITVSAQAADQLYKLEQNKKIKVEETLLADTVTAFKYSDGNDTWAVLYIQNETSDSIRNVFLNNRAPTISIPININVCKCDVCLGKDVGMCPGVFATYYMVGYIDDPTKPKPVKKSSKK